MGGFSHESPRVGEKRLGRGLPEISRESRARRGDLSGEGELRKAHIRSGVVEERKTLEMEGVEDR